MGKDKGNGGVNMSTLNMHVARHPKTGKKSVEVAEFTFLYRGKKVQIYMANHVQIEINDVPYPRTFDRSVPLLQLLYYIFDEVKVG